MSKVFIIKTSDDEEFYFKLYDANHTLVLRSYVSFSTMEQCIKGIETVRQQAINDFNYTKCSDGSGKPTFRLHSDDNSIIAMGISYNSIVARDKAVVNVKQCVLDASISDETSG